jgi:hypothetical protein
MVAETAPQLPLGGWEFAAKRGAEGIVRSLGTSRGKNSQRRIHLLKRWGAMVGREHQTGRCPFRREMPGRGQRDLEATCPGDREVFGYGRAGREIHEGRCFMGRVPGESAREVVSPRRAHVPDST